jgi:signal transduction histidine kinase
VAVARVVVVIAGLLLGLLAYRVQMDNLPFTTEARSLATLAYAWAFIGAGLTAWSRRRDNRLGPMMMILGFAMLARQFRYADDPLAFTVFFAIGELPYALFAHTVLAYPTGRVTDRLERAYLAVGYTVALVFPIAILLFYDGTQPLRYFGPLSRESLLVVDGNADVVSVLQKSFAVTAYGFLAAALIALIIRRLVRATPYARRMLAPLLVAAAVAALRAVFDSVLTFASTPPAIVYDNLFWWQVAGLIAVPIALLVGLLRSRLAQANVAELVVKLQHTPPYAIRDELARALDDPTLEIYYWLPERAAFADTTGRTTPLPEDGRSTTKLEHDGRVVAALVHDSALEDEPELIQAVAAAARLALENAQLHAEVQAQLAEVEQSRARIVAAGDEQRRKIERDLHDGAQQRLVALALELKRAQRALGTDGAPDVDRLLGSTADELQVAVQELRDLAAGIHPPLLAQEGLHAALVALAARAPLPVDVEAPPDRLPPDIEGTAYFVASEALTNVVKHADASRARITARREGSRLTIEIEDDGRGGASPDHGTGLRGLRDRVEARGGQLRVESRDGGGTRVYGEIPCGS